MNDIALSVFFAIIVIIGLCYLIYYIVTYIRNRNLRKSMAFYDNYSFYSDSTNEIF